MNHPWNGLTRRRLRPPCCTDNGSDCESRTDICHTWCPAWLKYEAARAEEYNARLKESSRMGDIVQFQKRRRWSV